MMIDMLVCVRLQQY